ncbi:MAG: DMT family transporter [Negativicutes bacterium]|nr:DMT family transporter [Negativicutes bacterium]
MNAKLNLILSMTAFGTIGLFVRNIPLTSAEIAFFRALIAAICLLLYKFISKTPLRFSEIKHDLPLLFLSGAAMGFNWVFLFEAYQYTSISLATMSYYFAPVIVTLVSPLLFHEKLTRAQLFCFMMSTLGLLLVIGNGGFSGGSQNLKGILFGLGAALLYATVILLNKSIRRVSGIDRTLLQFLAVIFVLFPYLQLSGGIHTAALTTFGLINLLLVGILHTGITYCLYLSSLKDLQGQEAALLSYIDPLVAVLISVLFLQENSTWQQILGGLMILGFTLLNEVTSKKKPAKAVSNADD